MTTMTVEWCLSLKSRPMSGYERSVSLRQRYMPILWAFFLKDMPSGLVLYWLFSNLLTIIQQLVMNRLVKEDPAPPTGGGAKALKQARA